MSAWKEELLVDGGDSHRRSQALFLVGSLLEEDDHREVGRDH